jgi:hypothetical protein
MGFWKSLQRSAAKDAAKKQARKAQIAEVKASKAGHRTGHNLRKAERLQRSAERSQRLANQLTAQQISKANAGLSDAVRERVGLRPGEPATRVSKTQIEQAKREIEQEERAREVPEVEGRDEGPDEAVASMSTPTAPEPTQAAGSVADELAKLAALRDSGVLTSEEFEVQKAKLLAS